MINLISNCHILLLCELLYTTYSLHLSDMSYYISITGKNLAGKIKVDREAWRAAIHGVAKSQT